jgi:hypothetical protein
MIADSFVELGCVHPRRGDEKEGFEPRRHEGHEEEILRAAREYPQLRVFVVNPLNGDLRASVASHMKNPPKG